jgi:hypothetical protein
MARPTKPSRSIPQIRSSFISLRQSGLSCTWIPNFHIELCLFSRPSPHWPALLHFDIELHLPILSRVLGLRKTIQALRTAAWRVVNCSKVAFPFPKLRLESWLSTPPLPTSSEQHLQLQYRVCCCRNKHQDASRSSRHSLRDGCCSETLAMGCPSRQPRPLRFRKGTTQ